VLAVNIIPMYIRNTQQGATNEDIDIDDYNSPRTVSCHLLTIFKSLGSYLFSVFSSDVDFNEWTVSMGRQVATEYVSRRVETEERARNIEISNCTHFRDPGSAEWV
jgi:hypothetical protein